MIGVAVVGVGFWGPNLLRNFDNLGRSSVRWVIDSDPSRLKEAKQRYPNVAVAESIDLALADPAVQAVVVATPPATHYQFARVSLEHDKHVLVEKPIALNSQQAVELKLLAESRGSILMVGHEFVHNRAVRAIKQYLDDGEVGRILHIDMARLGLGKFSREVDAAWDLMPHDLSMLLYWLGQVPTAVVAYGASFVNDGIDDLVHATVIFPNQVVANIQVSWLDPRKTRQARIVGDRKMLTFDDRSEDEPVRIYDSGINDPEPPPGFTQTISQFRDSIREGSITIPPIKKGEPLADECRHFLDCISSGQQPETSAQSGIDVVRILEALDRSRKNGSAQEAVDGQDSVR